MEGVDWVAVDLTDDRSVISACEQIRKRHGTEIASVIHLAAYYDFSGEPSVMYKRLTVEGTRRLLRTLRSFNVEQFVFSSSMLVMEPADEAGEVLTESSPTRAAWAYPRSKLAAEEVIENERDGVSAVILRIGGVYDDDCHSIPLAQQISRINEAKVESFLFPGDPDHGQPFVHLNDLAECLTRVVERRQDLEKFEIYLIAEPELMSYEELQDRIGDLIHGYEWPTIRIPKTIAKAGAWIQEKIEGEDRSFIKPWMIDLADDHYPVEIRKAKEQLGWEPCRHLRNTLEEMIRRLRRNPAKWYAENGLKPHPEKTTPDEAARG